MSGGIPKRPTPAEILSAIAASDGSIPPIARRLADSVQFISDERAALYNRYLAETKIDLFAWMKEFVPLDTRVRLGFINRIKFIRDVRKLAACMFIEGDGPAAVRMRFESFLLLSIALFCARTQAGYSMDAHVDAMGGLLELLEAELFDGERDVTISMRHEAGPPYRVTDVAVDKPLTGSYAGVYVETLLCRLFRGTLPILYEADSKDAFKGFVKMLDRTIEGRTDAQAINDWVRARMVVRTPEDVSVVCAYLRKIVPELGGEVQKNLEKKENEKMNGDNRHSSLDYRAQKLVVLWHGILAEFQVMDMQVYYNTLFAEDDSNHAIYSFNGSIEILKRFKPKSIYHVNFDDPVFVERQKEALRRRIRVDREARGSHF